jgi:hypothetical protein
MPFHGVLPFRWSSWTPKLFGCHVVFEAGDTSRRPQVLRFPLLNAHSRRCKISIPESELRGNLSYCSHRQTDILLNVTMLVRTCESVSEILDLLNHHHPSYDTTYIHSLATDRLLVQNVGANVSCGIGFASSRCHCVCAESLFFQCHKFDSAKLAPRSGRISACRIHQHLSPGMRILPATRSRVGEAGKSSQGDSQDCVL